MDVVAGNANDVVPDPLVPIDFVGELGKSFRSVDLLTMAIQTLPWRIIDLGGRDLLALLDMIGQGAVTGLAREGLVLEFQQ